MSILAGKPRPKKVAKRGDRVMVVNLRTDSELVGWVINVMESGIRISSEQADDGRPDPLFDWIRSSHLFSEVQVLVC